MRVSQLLGETSREAGHEVELPSHRLLVRAGYIRQLAAGIFTYLPLAVRSLAKISTVLREEMERLGAVELSMPLVHPSELWASSGRLNSIDETLTRFRDRRGHEMVLAMTHEEVVTDLARAEIRSYRQLPLLVFQIQTKFRDEIRPRGGLIRGREFLMKDSYSLDRDQDGLEAQYRAHYEAYHRIFERLSLPVIAVRSDPGDMGGKVAHEFMYLSPVGEDTLARCPSCGYAANLEFAADAPGRPCPECGGAVELARGVEVGNIFQLGTRYSAAMGATYVDSEGGERPIVMGSYGIGVGRVLACLAEEYQDDLGLCLPEAVASFTANLLAIGQPAHREAQDVYRRLCAAGVDTLFDDRDLSPGVKMAEADLRGCPWRVTVSQRARSAGGLELRSRATGEAVIVSLGDLIHRLSRKSVRRVVRSPS